MFARTLQIFGAVAMIVLALSAGPALPQGFSGLGTDAKGFSVPERGNKITFPRDHGAHHDYRIEWWYLTANLTDELGEPLGVQWTLFRSALRPDTGTRFTPGQIWFAHAAVTNASSHLAAQTVSRGAIGAAGVEPQPFRAFINDWVMAEENKEEGADALSALRLTANAPEFAYDLRLDSEGGPLVLHGDGGYSVKSNTGQASYYYSQPYYRVSGTVTLSGRTIDVTGQAWLDREWSSQPLSSDQNGWDWVSIHFDDGSKLMGFQLRTTNSAEFTAGTWINADGSVQALENGQLKFEPDTQTSVAGRQIPTRWRVTLAERDVDIVVEALNPLAWMDLSIAYWEGPVLISGTHTGSGYLEMTGY